MVEVGGAWTGHAWQIMQVWISFNTPEDKIAETAIAAATKADHSGSIAGAWLAHYTHEDFLFAQEDKQDNEDDRGGTKWCMNDPCEAEATHRTNHNVYLCATCANAYRWGQENPDGWLETL
jgi:hypothetical protein